MDENTKHLTASNLTIAYFAGQERRPSDLTAFVPSSLKTAPNISPKEIFAVYRGFLDQIEEMETSASDAGK